jgi:hypothetical protein
MYAAVFCIKHTCLALNAISLVYARVAMICIARLLGSP